MKARDIVIGLVVLVILITAVLVIKRSLNKKITTTSNPQTISIQQKIQNTFPGLTIPNDGPQINLTDVTGGQSFGIVTKNEILANLPDLPAGKTYLVWLGNSDGKTILLGNLKNAKGGYLLDYNAADYPGFNKIIISSNGKNILEGSF